MSTADLASGMEQLTAAITDRESHEDWWLVVRELAERRDLLCQRLPVGHPYRGGEYCE